MVQLSKTKNKAQNRESKKSLNWNISWGVELENYTFNEGYEDSYYCDCYCSECDEYGCSCSWREDCCGTSPDQVSDWPTDHDDVRERRSPVFRSPTRLLSWTRDNIQKVKKYDRFRIHSFPKLADASCSCHTHFAPLPSYKEYNKIYNLTRAYQFFFKNAPRKHGYSIPENVLSERHWSSCYGTPRLLSESKYDSCKKYGREDVALTPNLQRVPTLEFRYMDFYKSPQQFLMYAYLVAIAKNVSIHSKNIRKFHQLPDLQTTRDMRFYSSQNVFTLYLKEHVGRRTTYESFIRNFTKDLMKYIPDDWKFMNMYDKKYYSWDKLVEKVYNRESRIYRKFFNQDWSDKKWSNRWLKTWNVKIPRRLLIDSSGDLPEKFIMEEKSESKEKPNKVNSTSETRIA